MYVVYVLQYLSSVNVQEITMFKLVQCYIGKNFE